MYAKRLANANDTSLTRNNKIINFQQKFMSRS